MSEKDEGSTVDIPTLVILEEDTAPLYPEDGYFAGSRKTTVTSQDVSFGNSNSMIQHSLQNSTLHATQSTQQTQTSPNAMFQYTHSIHNTYSIRNTHSQSTIHTRYGDADVMNRFRRKANWIGESIRHLREASLSISMLARPSDDRKASSFLAGWNVSNLIQGTTILGIPYSIQRGGWVAVGMLILIGFLTCHTGKLIVDCMYESSKKSGIRRRLRTTFPEVAKAAMGNKGMITMNIIQNSVMFGGVVMYIILLGTVWADLMNFFPNLGVKEWACINCVVTLPALFITKMSIISWFSMLSVFSMISAFLALIAFSLTQIHAWDVNNIPPFDIETFPIGFGMILFSYCAHAVLPNIEGSMKSPGSYRSMMNISFSIASVSKAALGVLMVLTFGKNTAEVITVNLKVHEQFRLVTSSLVIFNVLLAMPLEMFVVSVSYDDAMLKYFSFINRTSGYHWVWLLISRPLLLAAALLLSVTIPRFGLLMGLVGSVSGTALCLIFPCYCHLKLRWDTLRWWNIFTDISIIIFGFAAGIVGLFFSIKALIRGS